MIKTTTAAGCAITLALAMCVACKQETTTAPIAATSTAEPTSGPTTTTTTTATATTTATTTTTATATASTTATATATASAAAPATSGSGGVVIHPPPDAARDAKITATFGKSCVLERTCGALWGIDCQAASDGPYWYVKASTLERVSGCGGLCMGGRCTNCPPKEWKCPTY